MLVTIIFPSLPLPLLSFTSFFLLVSSSPSLTPAANRRPVFRVADPAVRAVSSLSCRRSSLAVPVSIPLRVRRLPVGAKDRVST